MEETNASLRGIPWRAGAGHGCLDYVAAPHSSANDWGIKEGDAVTAQLTSASIPIPKQEQSDNIVANESKGVTQTEPQPSRWKSRRRRASNPGKSYTAEEDDGQAAAADPCAAAASNTHAGDAVPYGEGGPVTGPYGAVTTSRLQRRFQLSECRLRRQIWLVCGWREAPGTAELADV